MKSARTFALTALLGALGSLGMPSSAYATNLSHSGTVGETRGQARPSAATPPARQLLHVEDVVPLGRRSPGVIHLEPVPYKQNAPKVEVGIAPMEDGAIVYHPVAPKTSVDSPTAQVYLELDIKNVEDKPIGLNKVRLEYAGGTKEFRATALGKGSYWCETPDPKFSSSPTPACILAAHQTKGWHNPRPYHEFGDVLYLNAPIPQTLTIKLYFEGYIVPVSRTKPLEPYGRSFALPFKVSDLGKNELYEGASTHGGGAQAFAYDLGANGYVGVPGVGGSWSELLPGKDGSKNEHFRIWGKPVYAMADGEVLEFENTCPNNLAPGKNIDYLKLKYKGNGNYFAIRHAGGVVGWYSHMQKGSLNPKLLHAKAQVKKGDFLGKAGNAGSSSAPHLHVGVYKGYEDSEEFRALLFNEGFVIEKDSYPGPGASAHWTKLSSQGIPGVPNVRPPANLPGVPDKLVETKRSFIWPSSTHPSCAYATNMREVSRHGIAHSDYQREFDKIWTCGYYPTWVDGYDVGGKTYFNAIFRHDDGTPWVARHDLTGKQYQSAFDEWHKAGYRLINVDSYLLNGDVRYAAVWRKAPGPAIRAYHGATAKDHQSSFDKWVKEGWMPTNISVVAPGGQPRFTALYEKIDTKGMYARSDMTLAQYKTFFKQYGDQGFSLVYLNGYTQGGQPRLSGIWYKKPPFGAYLAKHYLTAAGYQSEYTSQLGKGFITRSVTGYDGGAGARFEGLWVK